MFPFLRSLHRPELIQQINTWYMYQVYNLLLYRHVYKRATTWYLLNAIRRRGGERLSTAPAKHPRVYYYYYYVEHGVSFRNTKLFSFAPGFSAAGHAGDPPVHGVWVPVGLCGTCSGRSKSRNLARNHGVCFRPARANRAHTNPDYVMFSLPPLCCSYSSTTAAVKG